VNTTLIAVQLNIAWEDREANFRRVRSLLSVAPPPPGSLVVLPEMFATGFSMNVNAVAEPYGGPTERFLAELALEYRAFVAGGVAARPTPDQPPRNKALVFSSDGNLLCWYAKSRLFTPGGEAGHFKAGDRPAVFQWGDLKVSPFICYDLRFPELFREAAAAWRPELFVVIANFPAKRTSHWVRLLQARAIENQAFVLGVNRVGNDPFYTFSGRSMLADPHGEILADAGEGEGVLRAELDLGSLRQYRQGLPFLDDLRWPGLK
jgi:predicted amidohydrolase